MRGSADLRDAVSGDALLLVGLGSSREGGAEALFTHAEALRRRGVFAEVGIGLLTAEPTLANSLRALSARVVRVVPFLMADGYLARQRLPAELRRLAGPDREMLLAPPIGTAPLLAELLADRVLVCCRRARLEPASVSVVVVGHGMAGSPASGEAVRAHVRRLEESRRFDSVAAAFLQEPPDLATVLRGRTAPTIVVAHLAGAGMHGGEDIPRLIAAAEAAGGPRVLYAGPIGTHAACADLIVAAAGEAAPL